RRFNTQRSMTRISGGELMLEVQSRVLTEIETLRARHPDGCVAIVSHMDVIKAAIAHFAGIHLDLLFRFEIAPASVSIVEVSEHGPRILLLNDTGDDT
nr:histidine phosphatase family protein [Acidobacteriota bacterium]